jgi:cysteine synthase
VIAPFLTRTQLFPIFLSKGTSGGGVLAAALELAKSSPKGTSILALIPDTGERYEIK